MEKFNLIDSILFKIGLVRKRKDATMFIHENGIIVAYGEDVPFLDSLLLFLTGYIVQMMDSDLNEKVRLARAQILTGDILEMIIDKLGIK